MWLEYLIAFGGLALLGLIGAIIHIRITQKERRERQGTIQTRR